MVGKAGRKEDADATDTVSGASNKVNKESPFDKLTPALSRGALLFPSAGTSSWRWPRGIKKGDAHPGDQFGASSGTSGWPRRCSTSLCTIILDIVR